MVFEIDFLRKLILEREILKIQQYDIYEKCSPDVGENDGRTFRIIGTHPEELLLHIHHSMISGFWTIFTDFRLQAKISRVNPPRELRSYDHVLSQKLPRTHPEELFVEISTIKWAKVQKKKSKMNVVIRRLHITGFFGKIRITRKV